MFVDLWLLLLLSSPWTVSLSENCLTMTLDSDVPSNGQFTLNTETFVMRCKFTTGNNAFDLKKTYCMEIRRFNGILINMSLTNGSNSFSPNSTSFINNKSRSVQKVVEDKRQQLMSCSCFFCNTTRRNYVNCWICSEADTDDTSWDKATFSIVTVAVIVGAGFVLSVIFRNKIITAWRRNDNSSRCANNSCTDKIEVIPERLHHTLANDTETSSSTSRLSSARTEVRKDYQPLQKSERRNKPFTTTQRIQIQTYIHRVFEEDDECEVYTEIIDDMECDPGPQARHEYDVTSPFLKTEGGQEVNDDDYNRLDHQSNRNKPTDCVSAEEENYRLLCCPDRLTEAQLCDEYEVAKPVTDSHVNSNKFANDNSLPDNTFDVHTAHEITPSTPHSTSLDYSSDEHTLHDSPLENKIPQHQTSNEHVSNNNLLHDNTPTERIPRDNPSPYYTLTTLSPEETVCDNILEDKLMEKVDCVPSCQENTSTVN